MDKHMTDGRPMTVDQMERHPNVRIASSGSWLDTAR